MKKRVYEILTNPAQGDRLGRFIGFSLIALNVAASVLETDAEIHAAAPHVFRWFETISVIVFTIEYVLRIWSSTTDPRVRRAFAGRLRTGLRPMMLVDLASIAPFYVDLLLPGVIDLRFLRVLRLLRIFRLMHIGPLAEAFARLVRVIQAKRLELGVSLFVVAVAMLISAGAMYQVEHELPNTQFTSIPRSMWWSIVTITTIGYGDMTPQSPLGQFIAGIVGFLGICSLALPVGIISSGYLDELNRKAPTSFATQAAAQAATQAAAQAATEAAAQAAPRTAPTTTCPHCGEKLDR